VPNRQWGAGRGREIHEGLRELGGEAGWFEMEFRKVVRDGVEYRFDPLTGEQCRINPERAKRLKQSGGGAGLREIVPMTRETKDWKGKHRYFPVTPARREG